MASIIFPEGSSSLKSADHKRQLLNNIVDGMAHSRPQALYGKCPKSTTSYEAGFYRVTYEALANAVNGVAWLMTKELGPAQNNETLTYIGPRDLRHMVMLLGAVKAGYKNSIPAYTHLFKATDCKIMFAAEPFLPVVDEILAAHTLRLIRAPSMEELLTTRYPHYAFEKTFDEARNEPLAIVHTSGTTSLPKPIVYSHDFAASLDRLNQIQKSKSESSSESIVLHAASFSRGIFFAVVGAIYTQTVMVFPLSGVPASAQVLIDGLKHTGADVAALTPAIVEEIAKKPAHLEFLSRNLKAIWYGSGDVSQKLGDVLMNKIKFFNVNGSTEAGIYPLLEVEGNWCSEDWKYIIPHPAAGLEFRHQSDDTYEAFIVRNSDDKLVQPVFKVFPQLHEYRVGDMFTPHPSQPGLWKYNGRTDDMIVLLSGVKANPIVMEEHVSSHAGVRGVLMEGTQRRQAGLLIEPMTNDRPLSTAERSALIDGVWPIVQEANQLYRNESRVSKSHIQLTDPQKPMARAGKGTVQRRATIQLYAKELDALHAADD
ncbi:hypothetical protein MMC07_002006 [Pseudocyphellaria aurata]|nr:hypothetical protein [Pseudocyphellaria aurata]